MVPHHRCCLTCFVLHFCTLSSIHTLLIPQTDPVFSMSQGGYAIVDVDDDVSPQRLSNVL